MQSSASFVWQKKPETNIFMDYSQIFFFASIYNPLKIKNHSWSTDIQGHSSSPI